MEKQRKLCALVYGSTGAIGKVLVQYLLTSQQWGRIIVVVRRELEEWKNHPKKNKLVVELLNDMDKLLEPSNFKYQNVDALFCCLGSQVKHGNQTFIKIDKTYPLCAADIALNNKIPQYLIVTSKGADQTSCFLYVRTKGEVQLELKAKKLPLLTILRPGLINNREGARPMQKIFGCLPCVPQIQASDLGYVLMKKAQIQVQRSKKCSQTVEIMENHQLLQLLQQVKKK